MTKKTRAPKRRKPNIDPFDLAMITGGPLPTTIKKFRAAARVADPFNRGLVAAEGPSLAKVFEQHHGRPMTEADADGIRAREDEVDAALAVQRARESGKSEAEIAVADLAERYERARIAALPCRFHVGMPEAEKIEAEARRAEAKIEQDRLAKELAEARARVTAPGSQSPSNWPDDATDDFQSIAKAEINDHDDEN